MKSKISGLIILFLSLLTPLSFLAKTDNSTNPPSWITVKYADLEQKSVSEYQMVTVTVTEKNMWWKNQNYSVELDYNQEYLNLVNVAYNDGKLSLENQDSPEINTTDNNFEVKYQFYLNSGYDLKEIPITITKYTDNIQSDQATVNLKCDSQTKPELIKIGDATVNYSVQNYVNDGDNVTFESKFEIVENSGEGPITLELKRNNMRVSDDAYNVAVTSNKGEVEVVDKNNFILSGEEGGIFNLRITADESALSAKDDRVEFFIFLGHNKKFERIEPTYFKSEPIQSKKNTRALKYIQIKTVIASFFVLLFILYLIANIQRNKNQENLIEQENI